MDSMIRLCDNSDLIRNSRDPVRTSNELKSIYSMNGSTKRRSIENHCVIFMCQAPSTKDHL